MTLAYKVEELLALRDSVSESAVSIEKFTDEDVVKEHVLRPSASASAHLTDRTSDNSLQAPTTVSVAPVASAPTQKKSSPSPSIKRGKAEKLLKEHGSPPGMRVTAGGRVVPSDLLPLSTSRYPDAAYRQQSLRANSGNIMPNHAQAEHSARLEIIGGQPVVVVGDRMFPLSSTNSNTTVPALNHSGPVDAMVHQAPAPMPIMSTTQRDQTQPGFASADLGTLKSQQAAKKKELRTVEQAEVLQSGRQSEAWRAGMIEKKRALIVDLDSLRKQIAALENDVQPSSSNSFLGPVGAVPGPCPSPSFLANVAHPPAQAMYSYPATNPYAPMMMYQHPYDTYSGFAGTEHAPFAAHAMHTPHSPGSASRRSHAIEIKPPPEENKKHTGTALDPKSPTYEPAVKSVGDRSKAISANPFLPLGSTWRQQGAEQPSQHVARALSQKPSISSVDTTDFFPTNTHEHSTTRLAPRTNEATQAAAERSIPPTTPEKIWPASPWNEGNSSRSKRIGLGTSLTSWPETFGTQHSSSSLHRNGAARPSPASLGQSPVLSVFAEESGSSNFASLGLGSPRENWADGLRQAAQKIKAPSTYQEGFQAGYEHHGVPHNPEVLQGYIQGLVQFLSDQTKKATMDASGRDLYVRGVETRTPSLRGLVAESLPLDSVGGMSNNRGTDRFGGQENIGPRKSYSVEVSKDTAATGNNFKIPVSHTLLNKPFQSSRPPQVSSVTPALPASLIPQSVVTSQRSASTPRGGSGFKKPAEEEGTLSCIEALTIGGFRQFSGNQLSVRGGGTPLSMQRFPVDRSVTEALNQAYANHRLSGLDGAMDDMQEMATAPRKEENRESSGHRSVKAPMSADTEEADASCFKTPGKNKPKATESPKRTSGEQPEKTNLPGNPPNSPKKSGPHSPAKMKMEQVTNQVTNKFRRPKKDDPRAMSPEDKMKRSEKWRARFQHLKKAESEEIEEYHKNNARK